MIYTIRTTSGREDIVVDLLMSKIRGDTLDIKSVFHPAEIKGYIFVEGTVGNIHRAMQGLMHVRGLIDKPVRLEEIQHFLEYKKARMKVDEGDIMEIIGGPFKGEKGRIIRVNKIKDEVTAELLEASIPIPVTIATEFVKIIKKAKPEEKPVEAAGKEEEKSVFDTIEDEKPEEPAKKPEPDKTEGEKPEEAKEKPKKRKSFLEELEEAEEE